ncbi:MAG TPA: hypothetical protein VLA21_04685, partial [Candidatus Limnocylindria bacterium]|nr:hypothetical protein [Candidatus Limnocylindria bacterium]
MKRTAIGFTRRMACLLLAVFLAAWGFPAPAGAVLTPLGSVTPDSTEAAHGGSVSIDYFFRIPVPAEGSHMLTFTLYMDGNWVGSAQQTSANSAAVNGEAILGGTASRTIPDTNAEFVTFNWTFTSDVNGAVGNMDGSFTVRILHAFGAWAHVAGTGGWDCRHARTCTVCGASESASCELGPWAHVAGTGGADSRHEAACSVCGAVPAAPCQFGAWAHVAGTGGADSRHIRTCSVCNATETAACTFSPWTH